MVSVFSLKNRLPLLDSEVDIASKQMVSVFSLKNRLPLLVAVAPHKLPCIVSVFSLKNRLPLPVASESAAGHAARFSILSEESSSTSSVCDQSVC